MLNELCNPLWQVLLVSFFNIGFLMWFGEDSTFSFFISLVFLIDQNMNLIYNQFIAIIGSTKILLTLSSNWGERQCGPTLWETTCKLIFENEYKKSTKIGKGWKEIFKFYGFKAADEVVFEFVDLGKCFCEVYNG